MPQADFRSQCRQILYPPVLTYRVSAEKGARMTEPNNVAAAATDSAAQRTGRPADKQKRMLAAQALKKKSDKELIDMADLTTSVHVTDPKRFKDYFKVGYEYADVTSELASRGYAKVSRWEKQSQEKSTDGKEQVAIHKPSEATIRKSYTITVTEAKKWKDFADPFPYPSVLLELAMERFISDVDSGKIILTFEHKK